LNQTFKDFELLIVDDASSDRTLEILKGYKDQRIRLIKNDHNIGISKSINTGLRIAKGDYIARMDSDDISLPCRLEKELEIIETNKDCGMVASPIIIIDKDNQTKGIWRIDKENNNAEEIFYTLFFENCIAQSTVLFNRKLVIECGGYSELFHVGQPEDYDLWIRLSKITKIIKAEVPLVLLRLHGMNVSYIAREECLRSAEMLFFNNIRSLSQNWNGDLEKLLFIKDNGNIFSHHIFDFWCTLNEINDMLIQKAPDFLDKSALKRCCAKKRNKIVKNFAKTLLKKCYYSIDRRGVIHERYRQYMI
jgi:glycosyltransferase involved in cell wall biosynthesis